MAVREINLIPDDFLLKRKFSSHLGLWISLLILCSFPILSFHIYWTRSAHAERPRAGSLKEMDEQYGMKMAEVNRIRDELAGLDQQEAGLETEAGSPVYSLVLSGLARVLGPHTWITRLDVEEETTGKNRSNMNMKGFSKSGAELGELIEDLSGRALFQEVSLIYARQAGPGEHDPNPDRNPNLIEFHIECKVKG